jgi:hypothetical protein
MAAVEDWSEVDALIAAGKEALGVFAIYRSVGGPLEDAYRLFYERLDVLARQVPGGAT